MNDMAILCDILNHLTRPACCPTCAPRGHENWLPTFAGEACDGCGRVAVPLTECCGAGVEPASINYEQTYVCGECGGEVWNNGDIR